MKQFVYSLIITVVNSILMFVIVTDNMDMLLIVLCSVPVLFILILFFLTLEYFIGKYIKIFLYAIVYYCVLINLALLLGMADSFEDIPRCLKFLYGISDYISIEIAMLSLMSCYAKIILNLSKG